MSKSLCGFLARLKTCTKGPKGRHKCGDENKRVRGAIHTMHRCKHCGSTFTEDRRA